MTYVIISGDELYHHGIKGMKWGVRRYQNADGSLKAAGRKRYTEGGPKSLKGNLHRLAAKNYELNEKTYEKMGNKTLASMNRAAKENSLKKAEAADAEKAKRHTDNEPGKLKKFVQTKKANYRNFRNYRKMEREASEKYNLEEHFKNKTRETRTNRAINKMVNDTYDTNYKVYDDFNPIGDKYAKKYERQAKKAEEYVNKKFTEEFGSEKLEQAKKTEAFVEGAEAVAAIVGAIGLYAYSMKR